MNRRFFEPGIRRKLWISILLPMTALVIAACAIPAIIFYNVAENRLEDRVQNLAASTTLPMQTYVWQYNLEAVQQLLDTYVALGAVTGAQVTDGRFIDLVAGTITGPSTSYSLSVPLYGANQSSERQIGTLTLEATDAEVWELIFVRMIATIVISISFVLLTAYVALRLLNRTLLRPILKISETLETLPADIKDLNIDLSTENVARSSDELTDLVKSIHGMRDQILFSQEASKSSEKKLARAASLTHLGYATFDPKRDCFLECDTFFSEFCDMPIDQVLSMSLSKDFFGRILRDEDPASIQSMWSQLNKGRTVQNVVKYCLDSGEVRYVRQILQPSSNLDDDSFLVEVATLDVTEQQIAEESLLQAQKMDAIGKLTGGVAHDFNNLLAIISGNIEVTLLKLGETPVRGNLETALSAVESGANLTQQLLSFARKQPLSPIVIDAAKLIKQSSALLRSSVGEAIDLEIVSDGGLWNTFADPEKLKTTLLNLVVNSRDAMPEGGALTIEVSNARLGPEYALQNAEVAAGQYVCVTVTDSGTGMSDTEIQHAIEPFFTTKSVGKGTGLGLAMAFGFAKQSGGHLKIYSEIGKGTSVKLYLPRARSDETTVSLGAARPLRMQFNGLTVFVIEDSLELRKTVEAMLLMMGCIVHSAEDGPAALNLAATVSHVDVILSDVVLPGGLDGNQLTKELAAYYPEAAVIFMSGFTENSIIHNGRLDEGVLLLQKPFTTKELAEALLSVEG